MSPRAQISVLHQPNKAREADTFSAGLRAHGFAVVAHVQNPTRDDVLLCWNRSGHVEGEAKRFEAAGARVVVAENGYLGASWRGARWYALALGRHSGLGRWPQGGPERWDSWAVGLAPMRAPAGESVFLAQRGIGEPALRSPNQFAERTARRFGMRIRVHPGKTEGKPLEEDLRDVSRVATWSSGAAIKALVMGIHVHFGLPGWIAAAASTHVDATSLDHSDRRLPMFRRLSWAMWSEAEAASGAPFKGLLQC